MYVSSKGAWDIVIDDDDDDVDASGPSQTESSAINKNQYNHKIQSQN